MSDSREKELQEELNELGIYFYCQEEFLLLAVNCLGSMNNAHVMFGCVEEFMRKGVADVCIDFQKCKGFDSTFIGTLLIINEECSQKKGELHLINLSKELREKLDVVGISEIFNIDYQKQIPDVIFEPLPDIMTDEQLRMTHILRAHEIIVEKNPGLKEKFGVFIKELKKGLRGTTNFPIPKSS